MHIFFLQNVEILEKTFEPFIQEHDIEMKR